MTFTTSKSLITWTPICHYEDLVAEVGKAAFVKTRQVALFRLSDNSIHAVSNYDPFSGTNTISRGIIGTIAGKYVVYSPMYKQPFSLETGICISDSSYGLAIYPVRVDLQGIIQIGGL